MNLFSLGNFSLHSGGMTNFRIDCEAFSDDDLRAIASIGYGLIPPFSEVYGIPQGGLRFANAMRLYQTWDSNRRLIVDDVLTTGASFKDALNLTEAKGSYSDIGLVIFARGPCPSWVTPIFELNKEMWHGS